MADDGHAGRWAARCGFISSANFLTSALAPARQVTPRATADHQLGAEFFGERHFLLQTERPEIVARDAAHARCPWRSCALAAWRRRRRGPWPRCSR